MAWQSGGSSNDEMVDNLQRFGVIHSDAVVEAFRAVDRSYFVPPGSVRRAHSDEPLREGNIHISAPHIYGCIVEALHLTPKSSTSFLNIGSGTGYLSSIVAHILGATGICHGIEINEQAYDHGMLCVQRWKDENRHLDLPWMEFIHGNGLHIDTSTGETVLGFDRIYVGAAVDRAKLRQMTALLRVGGILVGPVDDELLQITRLRCSSTNATSVPRSVRGVPPTLSEDFTEHVITGVRFATLLNSPVIPTTIRSRIWDPALHKYYPESFRNSCKEILLCSRAPLVQPPPVENVTMESRINLASQLPKSVWMEILSFTHRDWFTQPESETDILRRRLEQEQLAVRRADEARRDAEMRLRSMERERDGYRRLALRSLARLQALLQERGVEESEDMHTDDDIFQGLMLTPNQIFLGLSGMSAIVRRFHQNLSDDDEVADDDHEENDHDDDDEMNLAEVVMETLDDHDDSDVASDDGIEEASVETFGAPLNSSEAMAISRPPRTVSLSSDDMKISR